MFFIACGLLGSVLAAQNGTKITSWQEEKLFLFAADELLFGGSLG
jgi:hypothetical protein